MAFRIVFVEMWHFSKKRVIYIQFHGKHKMEKHCRIQVLNSFPTVTQRRQAPGMKINVVKVYDKIPIV